MADLATMQAAATQQGATAPPNYPGGPAKWLQDWYQNAVNAGSIVAALPGDITAEGGGTIHPYATAASSADWLGKRKPTVQELRKWAQDTNQPEDYLRYSDAAVSGMIDRSWDVAAGSFRNNYGDLVAKPDDRGPNTPAGFNGTGDRGGWDIAGGGGGAAAAPTSTSSSSPLSNALFQQWAAGQGMFGLVPGQEGRTQVASTLPGGALWWGTEATPAAATTTPAAAATPATPAIPAATPATPATPASLSASLSSLYAPATNPATAVLPGQIDLAQLLSGALPPTQNPLSKALMGSGDWSRSTPLAM